MSHRGPDPLDEQRSPDGELPDGVEPLGVPTDRSGHQAFVLVSAAVVALLALIFTLSWVVYHQLAPDSDSPRPPTRSTPTGTSPTTPVIPTLT